MFFSLASLSLNFSVLNRAQAFFMLGLIPLGGSMTMSTERSMTPIGMSSVGSVVRNRRNLLLMKPTLVPELRSSRILVRSFIHSTIKCKFSNMTHVPLVLPSSILAVAIFSMFSPMAITSISMPSCFMLRTIWLGLTPGALTNIIGFLWSQSSKLLTTMSCCSKLESQSVKPPPKWLLIQMGRMLVSLSGRSALSNRICSNLPSMAF
mmetsp:Transcript_72965/g.157744  ORF Transcript_72965/g.157744 Transcript_72965/m.157744 type:complete len:207 (+) Transcript_72965:1617-2237(+)